MKREARNSRAVRLDLLLLVVEAEVHPLLPNAASGGRARARRRCSSAPRWSRPRSSWRASAGSGRPTRSRARAPSGPSTSVASSVSSWLRSAHSHFAIEPSGPGIPVFIVSVRARIAPSRSASEPIFSRAIRSRSTGSSPSPRSLISSTSSSRSRREPDRRGGAEPGALVHQRRDRDVSSRCPRRRSGSRRGRRRPRRRSR